MAFLGWKRKLDSCNKRKVYHSLARKTSSHEIGIKQNTIDLVVEYNWLGGRVVETPISSINPIVGRSY